MQPVRRWRLTVLASALVYGCPRFLIERAVKSLELSNFLMWYLRVELDDATCGYALSPRLHQLIAHR